VRAIDLPWDIHRRYRLVGGAIEYKPAVHVIHAPRIFRGPVADAHVLDRVALESGREGRTFDIGCAWNGFGLFGETSSQKKAGKKSDSHG
jgi:hypothetical protein